MVEYYRKPTEPSQREKTIISETLGRLMREHIPQTIVLRDPYTIYDPKCELFRAEKRFKQAVRLAIRELAKDSLEIQDKRSIRVDLHFQHWTEPTLPFYQWRATLTYDSTTCKRIFHKWVGIDNAIIKTIGASNDATR